MHSTRFALTMMMAATLLGAGCGKGGTSGEGTAPPSEYQIDWLTNAVPSEMEAGKEYHVRVELKNAGTLPWPAQQTNDPDPKKATAVAVSYHWLDDQGQKAIEFNGKRSYLPKSVPPGDTVAVDQMLVVAPDKPGSYRLQLTMVQDNVTWFETAGARTTIVPVKVR